MMKKIILIGLLFFIVSISCVVVCNFTINSFAEGKTFNSVSKIQNNKVGLVLGTTKCLKDGRLNLYFIFRINACVELFNSGKIKFVLISGDNGNINYDEPSDFKDELIKKGIPANKIFLDYAGFRTLDSIVRAKKIFGQKNITIISQEFHNKRAIYLANYYGIKAVGYNARGVRGRSSLKVTMREYLAKTKVFVDILFGVKPKFLGDKIVIS